MDIVILLTIIKIANFIISIAKIYSFYILIILKLFTFTSASIIDNLLNIIALKASENSRLIQLCLGTERGRLAL